MTQALHSYDPKRLSTYLQEHVAGFAGLAEIAKFSDGQSNPTYKLTDTAGQPFCAACQATGHLAQIRPCGRSRVSCHDRPGPEPSARTSNVAPLR